MNRGVAAAAGLLFGLLLPAIAVAQPPPALVPTRDIDATYRVTRGDKTYTERRRWLAEVPIERIDPPGQTYMLFDHSAGRMTLVNRASRTVSEITPPEDGLLEPRRTDQFKRLGEAKVAGLGCTEWQETPEGGGAGATICLTDEGVLLRIKQRDVVLMEAKRVTFAKQKGARFRVPAGYANAASPWAAPNVPSTQ